MTRTFWVVAIGWIVGVLTSAPFVIRGANGRGIGQLIPGLSPSVSEGVVIGLIALVPPLLAARVIRARRAQGQIRR